MSPSSSMRIPLDGSVIAQAAAVVRIKHRVAFDLLALRVATPGVLDVRLVADRHGHIWYRTGTHDGTPVGLFGEHAVVDGVLPADADDAAVRQLAAELVDRIVVELVTDGPADELDALAGGATPEAAPGRCDATRRGARCVYVPDHRINVTGHPSGRAPGEPSDHFNAEVGAWPAGVSADSDAGPDYDIGAEMIDAHEGALAATPLPEGLAIRIHRGTEGPRHDPYSFTQYDVRTPDGRRIAYRVGLGEWLNVDGHTIAHGAGWGDSSNAIALRFEALVGHDIDQLDWWEGAAYRGVPCLACGCEGCRGGCVA